MVIMIVMDRLLLMRKVGFACVVPRVLHEVCALMNLTDNYPIFLENLPIHVVLSRS